MRHLWIIGVLAVTVGTAAWAAAPAADRAAGRTIFESQCASCHQPGNYAGKSAAELEGELKAMVAGTAGHPRKLTLSGAAIANVAAYLASAASK